MTRAHSRGASRAPSRLVGIAAAALLLGAVAAECLARPSEQVPVGARAIAMGGAYSSLADDATALFWNPAGLARIGHQEITGAHANLFGSDINDNFAAFVLPLSINHAVGVDWYNSGFTDPELTFGENRIDLGYALKLGSVVSAGVTAKYLRRGTDLDGATVRQGGGVGMDLGVLLTPMERLRLGLVGQDILDTRVSYTEGGWDVVYPRNLRAAASYSFGRSATAALDVDDRWHLGFEAWPLEQVALRAGVEKDRQGSEDPTYSYGAGFKVGVFRLDYARVQHPTLEPTDHFGLAMEFNFNPAQIRIEKVVARDVYTSLFKTYASDGFGSVQVRNLQDRPVTAKVSVFIPELMEAPSEQECVLRPKAAQEIPMTAVFPEKVMAQNGDRPIQVQVSASYQSRRLMRTEKGAARCVAYGPGAIDWGAGVEQAAAFVTIRDPVVDAVAREASRTVALSAKDPFGNRNLSFAAALVDALAAMGVAYVPDPNNPYTSISSTPHAVDTIHYPAETLEKRAGDCDDTSVLMAALLGNVGVPTQLVDAPGHLFLLVDTGVHERNRLALAVDEGLYVVNDEEVWIPLETTAIGKGFAEAWKIGAENYTSWASRGRLGLVDVAAAQSRYEPGEAPGEHRAPALDATQIESRLARDAEVVGGWRREYLASHYGETRQRVEASAQALGEIAHVYFLAGKLDEARARLEQVLAREPKSAAAHNNIAVTYMAQGEIRRALENYQAAVAADPSDPGIWLNLGLARGFSGDTAGAAQPLAEGLARAGGYAQACRLLGLSEDESGARQGTEAAAEARLLLRSALGKLPRAGAPRGERGGQSASGRVAPKGAEAVVETTAEIRGILYWKN